MYHSRMKANCTLTCGGIQSNHERATVAVAKIGMKAGLVLRGKEEIEIDSNLLIN